METGHFKSFDQNDIFYRVWNYNVNKKSLVIIHRGHEHSERLNDFAKNDIFEKYNIFSYDLRGHGYTKTDSSPKMMDYVRDLEFFIRFIKEKYKIDEKDIFFVANSIGGVIATTWLSYYTPHIAGMALLAPAFEIKLYIPLAEKFIKLFTKIKSKAKVPSYVKSKVLTHDTKEQEKYDQDRLITKDINAKLLLDVLEFGKRTAKDSSIETPMIIFSAQKDYVVKNAAQRDFFINIESLSKEFVPLENFYHGIIFEEKREKVYEKLENFIIKSFNEEKREINILPNRDSLREYDTILVNKISKWEEISFKTQKFLLKKLGWLSNGMDIGLKHGFNSGPSLDYIYKNKPRGKYFIGKLLDKFYLKQVGWKGIRERKENLLKLVRDKINSNSNREIKILDVAGGVGNYLFDIKNEFPHAKIVINEFKMENIALGEQIIRNNNWEDIVFTNYDCFLLETYDKIKFDPDIVIISGIFELFSDNKLLDNTIKGVSKILKENGCIIYTGQPYHPQHHQIAYVLNSYNGEDWIMRIRSQQELDNLFFSNGFSKKETLMDDNGIFTVSLVERRNNNGNIRLQIKE